jgi:hypothetical protein
MKSAWVKYIINNIIVQATILTLCLLGHWVYAGESQPDSENGGVTTIDTTYFKEQVRLAGNYVNASEFDS